MNNYPIYVSILRGINVGGQRKILMADLKKLYENLGFKDVVTYIQSGNVIFKTTENYSSEDLIQILETAIFEQYQFNVPIIIRTKDEIDKTIDTNPFLSDKDVDLEKLHVTFLENTPNSTQLEKIKAYDYSPDKFIIVDKNVYLYCPIDYGHSKLSNSFFELKLKTKATTRNWKTVNKLSELAT